MPRFARTTATMALMLVMTIGCSSSSGSPGAVAGSAVGSTPPSAVSHAGVAPSPAPTKGPGPASNDVPSRIVIPTLGIDLPIVSGDLLVGANTRDYPLCDVAQYLTTYRHPGRLGTTTWIYAHAREGMFLPLLDAAERDDGGALIGGEVQLYSTAGLRYTYRISVVHRHAIDRSIAVVLPGERRLVVQTSEGPHGTVPKLQIAADFIAVSPATKASAMPSAAPRDCHG